MKKSLLILSIACLVFFGFYSVEKTKATPTRFSTPVGCSTQGTSATSLSTTTVSYLSAGTGTTTATCNMAKSGLGTEIFDTATFLLFQAGSSTSATINIDIQDSYNGVDWYSRSLAWNVDENTASSSPSLGAIQSFTMTFASSTQNKGGITATTGATTTRAVSIPVKTPFIRAIITTPVGAAGSAVWGTWTGVVQNP